VTEQTKRLPLSEVVRMLLERGSSEHHSVTLTRNAKGETQIDVVVRASDGSPIATPAEAGEVAQQVYDTLRASYPFGPPAGTGG
jgi:hypothetical protein